MARLVEGQRYLFRRNVHKLTVKRRILHTWICFLFNQKKSEEFFEGRDGEPTTTRIDIKKCFLSFDIKKPSTERENWRIEEKNRLRLELTVRRHDLSYEFQFSSIS